MKSILPLLVLFLGIIPLPSWAQPDSPDEFIAAVKSALLEKSSEKLTALTYTVGMSDSDKQVMASFLKNSLNDRGIAKISLEPPPGNVPSSGIMNGKKYEPTYPPAGQVVIEYEKTDNGLTSLSFGYTIVGGKYFLTAIKSTDLGWKGPPDKSLIYMVTCRSQDKVQVVVKWNASGVNQEQTFKALSGGVMGQYFKQVTVTSTDDETGAILTITEGGKEIFVSQPLKGPGTIEYKKN
jgi:hypothetical protein